MKRTERIETLQLCGGTLTAWEMAEVPQAYDEDEGNPEFWAVFERDGEQIEVRSANELYHVLVAQGRELSSEIQAVAGPLAHLTAVFLDQGRAINDPTLYESLEKSHGLSLRDHLPRVEGHLYRFLLADFSKPRHPRLREVEIDLRTGAIAVRPRP